MGGPPTPGRGDAGCARTAIPGAVDRSPQSPAATAARPSGSNKDSFHALLVKAVVFRDPGGLGSLFGSAVLQGLLKIELPPAGFLPWRGW
jgi:hypothetical protein